jgi:hypothetical protein
MTKPITRTFDSYSDATNAVRDLEAMGILHSDISIVSSKKNGTGDEDGKDRVGDGTDSTDLNRDGDVSRGASTGAAIGGVGGLLAGLGLIAIPGLGPIVAAGWLISTVAGAGIGAAGGAATGGIVGALKSAGHTDEDANVYAESVRRGGTLVSARVPDGQVGEAEAILNRHHAADVSVRGREYKQGGWKSFDENAPLDIREPSPTEPR